MCYTSQILEENWHHLFPNSLPSTVLPRREIRTQYWWSSLSTTTSQRTPDCLVRTTSKAEQKSCHCGDFNQDYQAVDSLPHLHFHLQQSGHEHSPVCLRTPSLAAVRVVKHKAARGELYSLHPIHQPNLLKSQRLISQLQNLPPLQQRL